MIKRIVKMTFRKDATDQFEQIFNNSCDRIRDFAGCESLELTRAVADPRIYFTISIWQSESDLNAYRHSELFKETWAATKALFDDKPQAWSTKSIKALD